MAVPGGFRRYGPFAHAQPVISPEPGAAQQSHSLQDVILQEHCRDLVDLDMDALLSGAQLVQSSMQAGAMLQTPQPRPTEQAQQPMMLFVWGLCFHATSSCQRVCPKPNVHMLILVCRARITDHFGNGELLDGG